MLILIAESKTMLPAENSVSPQEYDLHKPQDEPGAEKIIESLRQLDTLQLSDQLGLSASLAQKMQKMIYEFPNKALGNMAIEAFTGVVFKALDFASLDVEARELCLEEVGIISSLYGFLRPDDIIKPYRLDFKSKLVIDGERETALNNFWKQQATVTLVKTIQKSGHNEILNLMPSDASKCIDWKLVKRFAKVWKVDFVEMLENGSLKTPAANKLKTMRGLLLRQILTEKIATAAELKHASTDNYMGEGTPVYPDHLRFLC